MTHIDQSVATSVKRIPFYFGSGNDGLLAWLHLPVYTPVLNTGLVICPPLAVEYMSTYRSLRYVADYYAEAGIPSLRFDYHGTGDAAGYIEDTDRVQTWINNIIQATEHLKRLSGCEKTGLFGFRMGANLAALAAEKIDLDFLILWAAFPRGRNFVRENRALQLTAAVKTNEADATCLEAGGMVYWQQTVDDINAIDLTTLKPKAERVLIVPRDDFTADSKLKDSWESNGLDVEQLELPGSANMILNAYYAIVPHDSINKTLEWARSPITEVATKTIKLSTGDIQTDTTISHYNGCLENSPQANVEVHESIFWYGPEATGFALLTEPAGAVDKNLPVMVISNSGSTHRVGPSRLHVLLAREFARLGLRTLRIDVPGLGDTMATELDKENITYIDNSNEALTDVMTSFDKNFGESKYVLMGLCSGAYFSFLAAVKMKNCNIIESLLINPLTFYWEEGMTVDDSPTLSYSHWNWYMQAIRNPKSWSKLLSGKADMRFLFNTIVKRIKVKFSNKTKNIRISTKPIEHTKEKPTQSLSKDLDSNLMQIKENGRHLSLVLARRDPGYDILMTSAGKTAKKLLKQGHISIHFVENADHTFSKYKPRCDAIRVIVEHIKKRYL